MTVLQHILLKRTQKYAPLKTDCGCGSMQGDLLQYMRRENGVEKQSQT